MGLREEIEAAFGEAAAEGGVRQLSIDGDEEVWVAGVAATDGTLRTVERDEAVAAARAALAALGVGADDALFIHLGA